METLNHIKQVMRLMAYNSMQIIPVMLSQTTINNKRTCEPVVRRHIHVSALTVAGLVVDSEILF